MTKVLDSLCRTCMVKVAEQTNQIIASFHIFQTEDFAHKFTQCTNLQAHPDDEYPSSVCENCLASVLSLYDFQIMCRQSIDQFSRMLVENKPEPEISCHLDNNNSVEFSKPMANQVELNCAQNDLPDLAVVVDAILEPTISQLAKIKLQVQEPTSSNNRKNKRSKHLNRSSKAGITDLQAINKNQKTDEETTTKIRTKKVKSHEKGSHDDVHCNGDEDKSENSSDEEGFTTDSDCASSANKVITSLGLPKPKTHMCETCGTVLTSSRSLRDHRFIHMDKSEWPFVCDVEGCSKRFRILHQLNIHQKRHAGIKNYACPHCEMRFVTRTNLKNHINHHTWEKTWSCDFCPKVCNMPADLRAHIKNKHGHSAGVDRNNEIKRTRRFQCSFCDKAFEKVNAKKYHEMIHTGEKPHACDECGKKFRQPSALKTHMRTHIKDAPRGHVCRICGRAFLTSQNLKRHEIQHTEEKPYKCDECELTFRWPGSLTGHQRLHGHKVQKHPDKEINKNIKQPRRFHCSFCDNDFVTVNGKKYHEMIHTGEKPHVCDECGKKFRQPGSLKTHMRTHNNDAPRGYVCRICGRSYFTSQNLKYHEMKHKVEKPYKCDECDLTFGWPSGLIGHQRMHQRDKQVKEATESGKQGNSKDISKDE